MESIRKLSQSFTKRKCSFRVVDVPPDRSAIPTSDDAEKLAEFAKTKDLGLLAELGGVQGVVSALKTDVELGIRGDTADLGHRTRIFGSNTFRKSSFISSCLWVLFSDIKNYDYVVGVACGVYFNIAGNKLYGWEDGGLVRVLWFSLLIVFSILNNTIDLGLEVFLWKAKEQGDSVVVLRNGLKQLIPTSEVHVGDIVFVKSGYTIPADGLLLDGDQPLRLDASNLTKTVAAATNVVDVNSSNPFLSSGAILVEGQAKMLIISVGKNTVRFGKHHRQVITRLEEEVNILSWYLERAKWIFPVSFVLVALVRCFSGKAKYSDGSSVYNPKEGALGVSYLVAQILYAADTISFSLETTNFYSPMKVSLYRALSELSRCNIIIRNLLALEKIGLGNAAINVLVEQSTLTTDRVQASKFVSVPEFVQNVEKEPFTISPNVAGLVQQGIYLNTTGTVYRVPSKDKYQFTGSPCERAILSQEYLKLGLNWEVLNETCTIRKVYSSDAKSRRILVQVNDTCHLHRRGDAEVILTMCSSFYDSSGMLCCLNENMRNLLSRKLPSITQGSNANIALAHRLVSEEEFMTDPDLNRKENCYNLIGFIQLKEMDQDEILTRGHKEFLDAGVRLELTPRLNSANRAAEIETMGSNQGEDACSESADQVTVAKFCLVEELTGNEAYNESTSPIVVELLKQGVGLNSTSKLISCVEFSKGPIGKAIISWAVQELNLDRDELSIYRTEKVNLEADHGFGLLMSLEDSAILVHVKGSPENILSMCSSYYSATGDERALSDPERILLQHKVRHWESSKNHWVAFVHSQDENPVLWSLLGILILDQEKPQVAVNDEVSPAHQDLVSTEETCASATEAVGSDNGLVLKQINGPDLVNEDEDEVKISSEVLPVLVSIGIEDDTTRKTSDIVILDGNYSCGLPLILGWSGGHILHNSQMFLQYQITTGITSIVSMFMEYLSSPGIVGEELELTDELVQLIWVNLVMGLIAAVAFGGQKPRCVSNHTKPKQPAKADGELALINGFMVRNIVAQVAYQIIVTFVLEFWGDSILGFQSKKMDTITTFLPIFLQAFNMVNARKMEEKNVFSGMQKWFSCLVAGLILVPVIATTFLPGVTRLRWEEWMLCIGIGMGCWAVCFVSKFVALGWVVVPLMYVLDKFKKLFKAASRNLTGCR